MSVASVPTGLGSVPWYERRGIAILGGADDGADDGVYGVRRWSEEYSCAAVSIYGASFGVVRRRDRLR